MIFLNSCSTIPKGATVIQNFNSQEYLGTWYEIARMDVSFEKNLINTSANYSLLKNGNIQVINRGYNTKTNTWKEAKGIAKFIGNTTEGKLKVSFFRPFYGNYNIIALDKDYNYSLVVGNNLSYLWILSREKTIPDSIKEQYTSIAKNIGFPIDELIWVKQE